MIKGDCIFFCEPELADAAIALARERNASIVTPTVAGYLALARRNVKAVMADDVAEISPERMNSMGAENAERSWRALAIVDRYLLKEFAELRGMHPGVATGMAGMFKVLLDALGSQTLLLNGWLQRIDGTVTVLDMQHYVKSFDEEFFDWNAPKRPLYHDVARFLVSPELRAKVAVAKIPLSSRPEVDYLQEIKNMVRPTVRKIQKHFRPKGYSEKKALVIHYGHDLPFLMKDVGNIGVDLMLWHDAVKHLPGVQKPSAKALGIKNRLKAVFDALAADEEYRNCLIIEGTDCAEYVHRKLERYFCDVLPPAVADLADVERYLRNERFDMVLSTDYRVYLREAFIISCAKRLGIPMVVYQEGGGAGYAYCTSIQADRRYSDYFLSYGAGAVGSEFMGTGDARIIPVGSYRLHTLREGLSHTEKSHAVGNGVKTIYYVAKRISDMVNHYPYQGGGGGIPLADFKRQIDIIEMMAAIKGVRWVVKTVPALRYKYETFIAERGITGIQVEDKKLTDVLWEADGFVCDYPSTTLMECLLTDRPIALLYSETDCLVYGSALDLLKKRLYVSADAAMFPQALENLVRDCRLGNPMVHNTEFLEKYCVQSDTPAKVKAFFDSLPAPQRGG